MFNLTIFSVLNILKELKKAQIMGVNYLKYRLI